MKRQFSLILALALSTGALAQSPIEAPAGWKIQTKTSGARTFTPPDLRAGEKFSVTLYDAAPLGGKSLAAWLRAFAGTVGTQPGQLLAPLQIGQGNAQNTSGSGVYIGPNGTRLVAVFNAFSLDGGQTARVSRALASSDAVILRYQNPYVSLLKAMVERAQNQAGQAPAPHNEAPDAVAVPARVLQRLKPGGALVPGVYAGNQMRGDEVQNRFRVYIYPSGEYRICDQNDRDIKANYQSEQVGEFGYAKDTGRLNLDWTWGLGCYRDDHYCYFGRDAGGQPAIYAEEDWGKAGRTFLKWVAPPTKRLSRNRQNARDAAVKAEAERFKFATAPGRGVKAAQIQAVVHRYEYDFGAMDFTDEAFLLLRDGTVHLGLPCPPDQLDVTASRRGEPKAWGKWRRAAKGYQVAWAGRAWAELPGEVALPGAARARLEGHYSAVRATQYSHSFWGVTFGKDGRFSKDRRGGVTTGNIPIEGGLTPRVDSTWDDGGSGTVISGGVGGALVKTRNPKGDRQGTYSLDCYTLTLRYDNGQIARLPFFFRDSKRKSLWFEGNTLQLGLDD